MITLKQTLSGSRQICLTTSINDEKMTQEIEYRSYWGNNNYIFTANELTPERLRKLADELEKFLASQERK